jgi:hypothetical protein
MPIGFNFTCFEIAAEAECEGRQDPEHDQIEEYDPPVFRAA